MGELKQLHPKYKTKLLSIDKSNNLQQFPPNSLLFEENVFR